MTVLFDLEFPNAREGIFVPQGFATPHEVVDVVVRAEEFGFNAVWATDFFSPVASSGVITEPPPNWLEGLITLSYAAARTSKIKLGTGVLMLPYRDPTVLAKQVATLDRLSNGRLLLGIGLGAYRDEFAAVRAHQASAHRGNMLDEYLELLIRLLDANEAAVSLAGEYVSVEGVAMHPKPLQQPLPMYLPARGEHSYKRIARWGLMPMVPCANATASIEALRPFMEAAGKDMDALDIIVEGELHIGPTQEDAVKGYQHTTMGNFRTARCPPKARKSVETITGANWVGTVDHIVEKLSALREQGFRHFNILHLAADTLAERLEQMQLFSEEIMPRVRT